VACVLAGLHGRAARCVSEQRLTLPALWADQIQRFLGGVELPSGAPVLLHTEIMR
jgi:hypothetical protein